MSSPLLRRAMRGTRRSAIPARSIRSRRACCRSCIGKATRLAQFLSSAEKEYDAHIELGVTTTTLDRGGEIVARDRTRSVVGADGGDDRRRGRRIPRHVPAAAARVFSAKKIDGDRAYDLARRNAPVRLQPVQVTATVLEVLEWRGTTLRLRLVCSAGYYVRSLADAIGERLGTGAHLAGLVRTRSGDFTLAEAVGLDVVDRRPHEAAARVIPLGRPAALAAGHHADAGRRLAGGPRRVHRGPSHVSGPRPTPPARAAVCACCTPTGTWSPSPSHAPAGIAASFFASGRRTGIKLLVWD